jgi:hypothetical protein
MTSDVSMYYLTSSEYEKCFYLNYIHNGFTSVIRTSPYSRRLISNLSNDNFDSIGEWFRDNPPEVIGDWNPKISDSSDDDDNKIIDTVSHLDHSHVYSFSENRSSKKKIINFQVNDNPIVMKFEYNYLDKIEPSKTFDEFLKCEEYNIDDYNRNAVLKKPRTQKTIPKKTRTKKKMIVKKTIAKKSRTAKK